MLAKSRVPKVLMVLGSLPPMKCGVGDSMVMLAQHIQTMGVSTSILTSEDADVVPGVDTHRFMDSWSIWNLNKFLKKVLDLKPDIVHIQFPSLGYRLGLLPYFIPFFLWLNEVPVIQTWHEPPVKSPFAVSTSQRIKRFIFSLRYIPNFLSRDILVEVQLGALQELRSFFRPLLSRKTIEYIPVASNISKSPCDSEQLAVVRERYLVNGDKRKLVVYFGFPFPHKGIEQIFEIATPKDHYVVLIATLDKDNSYQRSLSLYLDGLEGWEDSYTVTGFLHETKVADLLCAADVVILPFRTEVTPRNGSFLAARLQGTPILTTSKSRVGFDQNENVHYCSPEDIIQMKDSLQLLLDQNVPKKPLDTIGWKDIARHHVDLYFKIYKDQ